MRRLLAGIMMRNARQRSIVTVIQTCGAVQTHAPGRTQGASRGIKTLALTAHKSRRTSSGLPGTNNQKTLPTPMSFRAPAGLSRCRRTRHMTERADTESPFSYT